MKDFMQKLAKKAILLFLNEKIILFFLFFFGILSWTLYSSCFIWDDSYFYLVIARNIIFTGQQTFSNIFPTNGFHPLWLYLLTLYSYVVTIFNADLLFNESYAIPLSAGVVAWGVVNFWKVADRLQLPKFLFVGLPLGYLVFFQVLYSEAHVYYATLSCLTLISVNNITARSFAPYLTGCVCALVFLSRLDSMFFIFCYFIWYLFITDKISTIIRFVLAFMAIVIPYLVSNFIFFGGLVPMSGWIKSSFPHIFLNKPLTWNCLLGYNVFAGVIPIAVSAVILFYIKTSSTRIKQIIYVYFFGSILHLLYTVLYTRFHTLYWWYYVPHIILLAFSVAFLLKERPLPKMLSATFNLSLVALLCCCLVLFRWHDVLTNSEHPVVKLVNYMRQAGITGKSIFVSEIPGIIAFYSRNNIIAADMVTANRKFYNSMRNTPNAIAYLLEYCKNAGKPIEYYLHMGSGFVEIKKRGTAIAYNDPKLYPVLKTIGYLDFGHRHEYASAFTTCILWKIEGAQEESPQ